jgi:hypothetical protein
MKSPLCGRWEKLSWKNFGAKTAAKQQFYKEARRSNLQSFGHFSTMSDNVLSSSDVDHFFRLVIRMR